MTDDWDLTQVGETGSIGEFEDDGEAPDGLELGTTVDNDPLGEKEPDDEGPDDPDT